MGKGRLEAFSDGVIAIIITIMVLELKAPHEASISALKPMVVSLVGYVLSFVYVGIYWNNHHHLFQAAERVDGRVLWANLHALFWLSLLPFVTGWMGEAHFAPWPVTAYGFVLLMCAVAWRVLSQQLVRVHGSESALARAIGGGAKERVSVGLYVVGMGFAAAGSVIPGTAWLAWIGCGVYALVAGVWLVPDRRIERVLGGGV